MREFLVALNASFTSIIEKGLPPCNILYITYETDFEILSFFIKTYEKYKILD